MKNKNSLKNRAKMLHYISAKSKLLFIISIVASLLHNLFNSLIPQIVRITVDSVVDSKPFDLPHYLVNLLNSLGGRDYLLNNLYWCAIAILAVTVVSGIFNYLYRTTIAKGSESFIKSLRDTLFNHIQKLPYSWQIKHQTGDIIQRCTSDTEVVRRFIAEQLVEVFKISFLIIVSICIMFSMNVELTLVAIVFIPIVLLFSAIFFKKISEKFLQADEKEGELSTIVQEALTGVRVVRAFGRERYETQRFNKSNEQFANSWIKLGSLDGYFWGIGELLTMLQILSIIVLGTIFAVDGKITAGDFIAFVSYNSALVWPIRTLGRVLVDMSKAFVSIDRINYILEEEQEKDNIDATTPPINKDIKFNITNFSYIEGQSVLKDINFEIKAGTTFGILGGTGSGKSTLMHLLNRLYELPQESGTITIGDTDIRNIKRDWLRQNIGIVLQEPFLFSRSIKENIAITNLDASLEEIKTATKIASIDHSINHFKDGYDTVVGERGITLSGGQKQRVAIARMIMQDTPVMIFDDSLSAVDNQTDIKIRKEIKENLGGKTVILISHRITTLMDADKILVLDSGNISQIGTHKELIAKNGIYKDIYNIQLGNKN